MWVFLQLFYAALLSPRGSKADESSSGSERLARREYVGWKKEWVNKSRGLMNNLYGCIWISVIDQSYKCCLATDLTISQGWPLIVLQVVADPTSLANSQCRNNHVFFSCFSTRSTFSIHIHPGDSGMMCSSMYIHGTMWAEKHSQNLRLKPYSLNYSLQSWKVVGNP